MSESSLGWLLLAATVVGFGVYFVAACIVGPTAASGLIVLVSLAIGGWFFSQIRSQQGWDQLVYLAFSVWAFFWGPILAMLYAKVYRFLKRPTNSPVVRIPVPQPKSMRNRSL